MTEEEKRKFSDTETGLINHGGAVRRAYLNTKELFIEEQAELGVSRKQSYEMWKERCIERWGI